MNLLVRQGMIREVTLVVLVVIPVIVITQMTAVLLTEISRPILSTY